jgi:hypothetical protein
MAGGKNINELTITELKVAFCDLTREQRRLSNLIPAVEQRIAVLENQVKEDSIALNEDVEYTEEEKEEVSE